MKDKEDDIVRLPPINIKLGSCPLCGRNIWSNHEIKPDIFRCSICGREMPLDDIIPF